MLTGSTGPGWGSLDSGTSNGPSTNRGISTGTAIRKTEPHQKCSSKKPPTTGPRAAPPENPAAQMLRGRTFVTVARTSARSWGELWSEPFEVVLDQRLGVGLGKLSCHDQRPDSVGQSHHFQGQAACDCRAKATGLQDVGKVVFKPAQMSLIRLPCHVGTGNRLTLHGDADAVEILAHPICW